MEKINKNKLLKKTALIRRYTHAYTDTGTYTLVNSPQAKEEISHQDASKRRKKTHWNQKEMLLSPLCFVVTILCSLLTKSNIIWASQKKKCLQLSSSVSHSKHRKKKKKKEMDLELRHNQFINGTLT